MAQRVSGERYMSIDAKISEIKRQLRLRGGYPFDLRKLEVALQRLSEGDYGFPPPELPELKLWEVYKVNVPSYAPPTALTLKKMRLRDIGTGTNLPSWERHPTCKGVNETPGVRNMRLLELPEEMHKHAIAKIMVPAGWRFALPVEGFCFSADHPDFQQQAPIAILGDVLIKNGYHGVLQLSRDGHDGAPCTCFHSTSYTISEGDRVLLVQEVPK